MNLKIEIEDKNGNIHLLIGVNHKLRDIEDSIILSGHIDTVRESEGHNCNVIINGNNLKGLGISDMKSFLLYHSHHHYNLAEEYTL